MDELPSSEFRRVYSKLKEPTLVTVNGHVIGKWTPFTSSEASSPFRGITTLNSEAVKQLAHDLHRELNRGKG